MNAIRHCLLVACAGVALLGCGGGAAEDSGGSSKISEIEAYLDGYEGVVSAVESARDEASAKAAVGEIETRIQSMERAVSALRGDPDLTLTGLNAAYGARITALDRRLHMALVGVQTDPSVAPLLSGLRGRLPKLK